MQINGGYVFCRFFKKNIVLITCLFLLMRVGVCAIPLPPPVVQAITNLELAKDALVVAGTLVAGPCLKEGAKAVGREAYRTLASVNDDPPRVSRILNIDVSVGAPPAPAAKEGVRAVARESVHALARINDDPPSVSQILDPGACKASFPVPALPVVTPVTTHQTPEINPQGGAKAVFSRVCNALTAINDDPPISSRKTDLVVGDLPTESAATGSVRRPVAKPLGLSELAGDRLVGPTMGDIGLSGTGIAPAIPKALVAIHQPPAVVSGKANPPLAVQPASLDVPTTHSNPMPLPITFTGPANPPLAAPITHSTALPRQPPPLKKPNLVSSEEVPHATWKPSDYDQFTKKSNFQIGVKLPKTGETQSPGPWERTHKLFYTDGCSDPIPQNHNHLLSKEYEVYKDYSEAQWNHWFQDIECNRTSDILDFRCFWQFESFMCAVRKMPGYEAALFALPLFGRERSKIFKNVDGFSQEWEARNKAVREQKSIQHTRTARDLCQEALACPYPTPLHCDCTLQKLRQIRDDAYITGQQKAAVESAILKIDEHKANLIANTTIHESLVRMQDPSRGPLDRATLERYWTDTQTVLLGDTASAQNRLLAQQIKLQCEQRFQADAHEQVTLLVGKHYGSLSACQEGITALQELSQGPFTSVEDKKAILDRAPVLAQEKRALELARDVDLLHQKMGAIRSQEEISALKSQADTLAQEASSVGGVPQEMKEMISDMQAKCEETLRAQQRALAWKPVVETMATVSPTQEEARRKIDSLKAHLQIPGLSRVEKLQIRQAISRVQIEKEVLDLKHLTAILDRQKKAGGLSIEQLEAAVEKFRQSERKSSGRMGRAAVASYAHKQTVHFQECLDVEKAKIEATGTHKAVAVPKTGGATPFSTATHQPLGFTPGCFSTESKPLDISNLTPAQVEFFANEEKGKWDAEVQKFSEDLAARGETLDDFLRLAAELDKRDQPPAPVRSLAPSCAATLPTGVGQEEDPSAQSVEPKRKKARVKEPAKSSLSASPSLWEKATLVAANIGRQTLRKCAEDLVYEGLCAIGRPLFAPEKPIVTHPVSFCATSDFCSHTPSWEFRKHHLSPPQASSQIPSRVRLRPRVDPRPLEFDELPVEEAHEAFAHQGQLEGSFSLPTAAEEPVDCDMAAAPPPDEPEGPSDSDDDEDAEQRDVQQEHGQGENPAGITRGKGPAPKRGAPNSVYEKVDNEDPRIITSRTTYNSNGKPATREDYYRGSDRHAHFDKETKRVLQSHKHIFKYNSRGQPIGRGKIVPME